MTIIIVEKEHSIRMAIEIFSPMKKPLFNIAKHLRKSGVHIRSRNGKRTFHSFFGSLSDRLASLIEKACGLSIELDKGVTLGPGELSRVLEHSIEVAERINEDLISIQLSLGPKKKNQDVRQLIVAPRTWSGEALKEKEMKVLKAFNEANAAVDEALGSAKTVEEAEKKIACILFKYFGVHKMKAYDVAEDGSVRVAHSFQNVKGQLEKKHREDIDSHFKDWVPPEKYGEEAMWPVVGEGVSHVLIENPKKDRRCRKIMPDGAEKIFEGLPFALIGEKNSRGRSVRSYKVDWKELEQLRMYGERAINGNSDKPAIVRIFHRLAEFKRNFIRKEEQRFLDDISGIASSGTGLDTVLAVISEKIAEFFKNNGKGSMADRVTIMLYDEKADSLVTRVIWTKGGVEKVSYYSGPEDQGLGRRVFDDSEMLEPLHLRQISAWTGKRIKWSRGAEGSLIAAKVGERGDKLGVIFVSSDTENAFTQDHVRILQDLSRRVGAAFRTISKNMERLNKDGKFGRTRKLQVYNADYLDVRLGVDIELARKEGKQFSVIYLDIDSFKHLNEAWSHTDVDAVLAKIFSRIINEIREGEVYRHGGEEIAVRVSAKKGHAEKIAERLREIIAKPMTVKIPYPDRMDAVSMMVGIKKRTRTLWPDSGVELEEVKVEEGRDNQWLLVVTVKKTVSVGVAEYREGDTPSSLINRADAAQKIAKEQGGNRVVVA
jgi:diguanylate cyclase (GGDEF)-like protein